MGSQPGTVHGAVSPSTDRRRECVVVIAAFNEEATIGSVVASVAEQYSCVVVDDGSTDGTAAKAAAAGAIVVIHPINRGQGAALQTGMIYAASKASQYIVTFDADGQHNVADVEKLIQPLVAERADVTLGSRFLGRAEGASRRRLMMLRVAVLFTRIASGLRVTDTHNGLRGFTREAAARITIHQDRMAHASEILDEIRRHDFRYEEVPVTVRYTDYSRAKGQPTSAAFRVLADYLIGRLTR